MSEEKTNKVPGYDSSRVGDYTILTPDDKKASVFQKVTPKEQYLVAREVANRAIDEINAIRANRQSSFTDGINAAKHKGRKNRVIFIIEIFELSNCLLSNEIFLFKEI